MNHGTLVGEIPANVSVAERASVTAGLANEVEEVNQYALVMNAARLQELRMSEGERAEE